MNTYLKIIALLGVLLGTTLNAAYPDEFKPVVKIFSGMSLFDHDMIKSAVVDDFILLEQGDVWDTDILLSYVKPANFVRKNHFNIISMHPVGDAVLINYWNEAHITSKGKETVVAWLESVVSVKTKDGWKLQQMHSTRINNESIPDDVDMVEMSLVK
ncbi:MAG: nuclear transport factor 2 family protein [Enterobacterales bacterium]|nr:nuclear transport factor 2 family protein [Enterobacterales bacterium]